MMKKNNNNYNNSTSRYMVSVNENSKKYVKTELVSIPTNDSLTDGTLNFICSSSVGLLLHSHVLRLKYLYSC